MSRRFQLKCTCVALLALGVGLTSCVERRMKITTRPSGALVIVNDEEVGVSPVTFSFLWYGDYDIMLRKPGYKTLKTHYRVNPPWYQYPVVDIVAETMIPATIHDDHELPTFELEPVETPSTADVVQRAIGLRDQAIYGGAGGPGGQ